MSDYPILVKEYKGDQAFTIACPSCHDEWVITADELNNEDTYPCTCGALAGHKFWMADPCKGCGKLGFYDRALDYCCSRVCQLQAEYKEQLALRRMG